MLTYREYITEVFDRPVPFEHVSRHTYRFEVKGKPYIVTFKVHGYSTVEIVFEYEPYIRQSGDPRIAGKGSMDILRLGDSITVFSTVASIIKHHFEKNKSWVKIYTFLAIEESRQKLYDILAKKMLQFLPASEWVMYADESMFEKIWSFTKIEDKKRKR